jgi:aryl-alcohol dehydrogenase-like predicted oxidoreductase
LKPLLKFIPARFADVIVWSPLSGGVLTGKYHDQAWSEQKVE